MRAGAWATNRDIAAAWVSWDRARQIADALPVNDPDRTTMRITPALCRRQRRSGSCGPLRRPLRGAAAVLHGRRDKTSLAIGMVGLVAEHMIHGLVPEVS